MSFLLSRRSLNNSLIGTRIQLLTSQKNAQIEKECSPTLKELRDQKKKHVKSFKQIFEGKTMEGKQNGHVNWWLSENILSPCNVRSSTPKKTSVFHFPTPVECHRARRVVTKTENELKIEKLLEVEREHGCDIDTIIGHLNKSFTLAICYKQKKISEISSLLFVDIKMMKSLHEEIYAKMSNIEIKMESCVDFIQYLGDMIANGEFECYVRHKLMEKTIRKFHSADPLSFIPRTNLFKILQFYGKWTSNVRKELLKKTIQNRERIFTCIDTETKLKELLKKLDGAEEVTRIKQITSVPLEKLIKLYEIIRHNGSSRSLFLIPDRHFKYGLRKPVRSIYEFSKKKRKTKSVEHFINQLLLFSWISCAWEILSKVLKFRCCRKSTITNTKENILFLNAASFLRIFCTTESFSVMKIISGPKVNNETFKAFCSDSSIKPFQISLSQDRTTKRAWFFPTAITTSVWTKKIS